MKLKLLIFLLAISSTLKAQNNESKDAMVRKAIEPKSPAAESLGAFGGDKINNFGGLPAVEVPVYEVKLKSLTIPIKLKYNNSGIKVQQDASWVGLGWSLDFGGVISRQVKNAPDDIWRKNFLNYVENGYLVDHGNSAENFSDQGISASRLGERMRKLQGYMIEPSPNYFLYANSTNGFGNKGDTQPDLFSFSIPNGGGKFVFGPEQKANLLNYEPYKIEYVLDNSGYMGWTYNGNPYTSNGITSFIITDANGNKFTFSDLEISEFRTEGHRMRTSCDVDVDAHNFTGYSRYTTGWYLTKIESAIGEIVTFTYANENLRSYEVEGSFKNKNYTQPAGNLMSDGWTYSYLQTASKRLATIETPYETITFVAGSTRVDVPASHMLSDVQAVSKATNRLIKQVHFSYGYFQGDLSKQDQMATTIQYYGNPYVRLKLTGIQTAVPDNPSISKYGFSYIQENAMFPSKFSPEQDFWGHYNANSAITTNIQRFPKIFINPDLTGADRFSVLQFKQPTDPPYYVLDGSDRNCNPNSIAIGTLEKITYPTGGYTKYEYEPHDFMYRGKKFNGGGLRVKTITDNDGISEANNVVRSYSYLQSADPSKSSGVIFDLPIFAYKENDCANIDGYNEPPVDFPNASYENFKSNTLVLSNPVHINGLGDQIVVGYSEVKESMLNNGYTWSKYTTPVSYAAINDLTNNGCSVSQPGCGGLYSVPALKTAILTWLNPVYPGPDVGPDFRTQDMSQNSFPFISNTNYDWSRGLLLNTKVFDVNNVLKKELNYTYKIFTPESGIKTIKGLFWTKGRNFNIKASTAGYVEEYPQLLVYYNNYNIITNINKMPDTVIETDYLGGPAPLTTTKTYDYSIRKFIKSQTVTDSRGRIRKTSYKYPFDLDVRPESVLGPQNPISYLVAQNIITDPIETTQSLVSGGIELITAANVTSYTKTPYDKIVPFINTHLAVAGSILKTDYTPAYIEWDETSEILNQDMRMKAQYSYSKFDEKSNLLEFVRYPNIYNARLWGYNKYYMIASVVNAKYADVFHENFEEFVSSGLSTQDDAKTGRFSKIGGYYKELTGLTNQLYKLTYWKKNGAIWEMISNDVNVTVNGYTININNTYQVDDIRFYPANSQMTTHTYEPLVGITSSTDANNMITYYEYDSYQRLVNVKDKDGNIVKHTDYNYKNQ